MNFHDFRPTKPSVAVAVVVMVGVCVQACDVSFLALPGSANIEENGETGNYIVFQQEPRD